MQTSLKTEAAAVRTPTSPSLQKSKRPPGPCSAREGVKIFCCVVNCAGGELSAMPTPVSMVLLSTGGTAADLSVTNGTTYISNRHHACQAETALFGARFDRPSP